MFDMFETTNDLKCKIVLILICMIWLQSEVVVALSMVKFY